MNALFPFFPVSNNVKKGDVISLVIAIVVYVVVASILGVALAFLAGIPVVGLLVGIVSTLIWIYEVAGIVLAILKFLK